MSRLEIFGIEGLPEIVAGVDLGGMIAEAAAAQGTPLADRDVVVVTQKIVWSTVDTDEDVAGAVTVEVDGAVHRGRELNDAVRDGLLRRFGYRVLRIPADLVERDLPAAVALVAGALR